MGCFGWVRNYFGWVGVSGGVGGAFFGQVGVGGGKEGIILGGWG